MKCSLKFCSYTVLQAIHITGKSTLTELRRMVKREGVARNGTGVMNRYMVILEVGEGWAI